MKIAAIVWNSHAEGLARAAETLPWLALRLFPAKSLEDAPTRQEEALREMAAADCVFLYRSTEAFWEDLEPRLREIGATTPIVCLSYDPSLWGLSTARPQLVQDAHRYMTYGGVQNIAAMLKALAREFGGAEHAELDAPPPAPVPWEGLWHPAMPTSAGARRHFASLPEYLGWYGGHCSAKGLDGPWVGLVVGRHFWVGEALEVEQLLISDLEEQGLRVVPIFTNTIKDDGLGNKGALGWLREVFLAPGAPRLSAVIKLVSFFLGHTRSGAGNQENAAASGVAALKELGVPVFQPVFSSSKSVEQWQDDPQGLGSEVAWSVAMPEFEGVIEPMYLGGGSKYESAATGAALERRIPVAERSQRLSRRVAAYIRLAQKPVSQRKVAFILHNDPCASVEATVGGAAKLDSLESVARILAAMKAQGYSVEPPATGAELIETIMARKAISEFRWTTVDEIVQKGGALARISLGTYLSWWRHYPEAVRARIAKAWGDPPGAEVDGVPPAMIHEGKIVVTGVAYGNAAICVQPKRGCAGTRCDGRVCKILHDPDVPPPHQYIATYRWLQEPPTETGEAGFGADVLIHVGTHGNLEFLPGKSVGLSASCLPDLALFEVPHLYIYNADNPPEGTIAKRRSYAALVDHMTTALTHTELYEELDELARHLAEWEQAKASDKTRAHMLEHLVRDVAEKANLLSSIRGAQDMDFPQLATALHEALDLIRGTQHDDGMHVFGSAPEGERLNAFLWSILRFDADDPRSLRRSLCHMLGLELDTLLADPGAVDQRLKASNSELLADVERLGRECCGAALACSDEAGFVQAALALVGERLVDGASADDLPAVFRRIRDVKRRVDDSLEIDALLSGMAGGYIEPGPSGIITRGREDILPTGRNFYSLDPRRLPTRAGHMVGMRLADAIIAKHVAEEGRVPENVAMFWMCNDMMWADGEGMAQIFHLIGVRPVWKGNGHVKGFEVIPVEELGRPRVDVTIRVSGLLRDSFPEQMALVDEAIHHVACLDEADEDNFVRKHARSTLEKSGESGDEAWRKSTLRLFSSKPGTYQAGVNLAVYASAWQTEADLADIFVYWNSYAYGRGVFGEQRPRQLEAALSTVDVSYNKVVSDEHDLFNCCGYYGTHGGMTAAARQFGGGEVKGYYGDTREPGRVQVRDLADEIRRVVRTRLLNPAWIAGMKRHGYKGAGDMAKRVGRVYGWEATTREVDDWIFDDIAKTFVMDEENREFFRQHNPWALEEIGRRLLEAQSRGLWQADPEVLDALKESYLEMEGWLEENMGEVQGDFQGGSVDVMRPEDVEQWQEMMRAMKAKPA
ncbi:cobaltochelatase subunit CobN [Humidesulfovibrio sp.]